MIYIKFPRLFRRKPEVRAGTSENTTNSTAESTLLTLFGVSGVLTREATLEIPTVSACINKISEAVSRLPVKLYRKNGEKVVEITDDNRLKLLNGETGDTLSTVDMWKSAIEDYFLGRGAWIYINSNGINTIGLHYVDSRKVSFLENNDPIFKAFQVLVNGKKYYDFQFLHFLRKTRNGYTNIPIQLEHSTILSAVYNSLKLENAMSSNGGCKSGFLKSKNRLSRETIDSIKEGYETMYANSDTKKKMVVLNDGIDFQEISATAAELQLNENKRTNSVEICKIFGFPHTVIDGGASDDDNKKFISAVVAVLNQIETALDSYLLLETEKEQGYYWAFDVKELTRGSVLERYQAYAIARQNNILQVDEIRREEDYEPLGFNYMTLGLADVLLNPQTMEVFTPNTGQTTALGEERAFYRRDSLGRFAGNGGGGGSIASMTKLYSNGGAKPKEKVDKSEKSDIINDDKISATGKNSLKKKSFSNKQKLNNHWQNGRTHKSEYEPDGIKTKEQYEKRAVELAESAVDGKKILGYKTKEGYICRYDVEKNDYVKADANKGIRTMFKPAEGLNYYLSEEKKEGIKNG